MTSDAGLSQYFLIVAFTVNGRDFLATTDEYAILNVRFLLKLSCIAKPANLEA
jgi:hypothetical protein